MVLCAQLSDWRRFRAAQLKARDRYRDKAFSKYAEEAVELRRRHEVGGEVRLLLDPKQQSRPENWMEFQNYHLKRLEQFEKKRDELKKELDDAQKQAEHIAGWERAAEDVEAIQQVLENAEWDLERHKVLLQWIEQERRAMDRGYPTPAKENNNDQDAVPKAVRRTSTRASQKERPEPSAVLGKVRVSKATSKKRNTQTQKPKAPELELGIQNSDVILQSGIPQARETKPRRTKEETIIRQLRPQRVSKANRLANVRPESRLSGPQPRGAGQTRSPDRARPKGPWRPQSAPEIVMRRRGRTSRQSAASKMGSGVKVKRPEREGLLNAAGKKLQQRKA